MEAGYASLSRLRRARVWWATADGLWDIDKVQQDGFDVAFAVDMQMNASYVRQLSKRTIAGKEDRARDGYHNGRFLLAICVLSIRKLLMVLPRRGVLLALLFVLIR